MTTAPLEGRPLREQKRTFNRPLFAAYAVASLAAIFYVPYFVPLTPTTSESYVFGYNNQAGVALLLALTLIGVLWTRGLGLRFSPTESSKLVSTSVLAIALAATLLACAGMWLFAGRYGGFGDSAFEIDKVWFLSQGKRPFLDFEQPYGIVMLYGPLFLHRLLGINMVQAFYAYWVLNFLAGTWLLYQIVNAVEYPSESRRTIFLLLFVSGLASVFAMSVSYTSFRFLCPIYFVLVTQRMFRKEGKQEKALACVAALGFTLLLLLNSPETAVAFAFASMSIFVFSTKKWDHDARAIFCGIVAGLAGLFFAALKLHALDSLLALGGGGISFPILPSPYILLFSCSVFLCACFAFRRVAEGRLQGNLLGIVTYSLPMVASALGRSDPGHVFWSGQGFFLASMFLVSNHKRLWGWYRAAFVAFVFLLPTLAGLVLIKPQFQLVSRLNALARAGKDDANRVDLDTIYPAWHGTFFAPFGYKPNRLGSLFSDRVDYGRYEGFVNQVSPVQIQETVAEMEAHPESALLVPTDEENFCRASPQLRAVLSVVLNFPLLARPVHVESLRRPVCDFIAANYTMVQAPEPANFGYGLWIAKSMQGAR